MLRPPFSQNQQFETLYRSHRAWVHAWLSKKIGSQHDAEDITQDTFIKILHSKDLAHIIEPRAYVTTIAHGLMVNHFKRRAIEATYLQALAHLSESTMPSPEALAITIESIVAIDNMLDGLPLKVRMAFLLCQLDGLSHAEIANQLSVSVSSVRKYIVRALLHCVAAQ